MNKKELRTNYHVLVKELLDTISTVYDAIGIINNKRGEKVIDVEDYGMPDLVKAADKASKNLNPSVEDFMGALVLKNAVNSVLLELEQGYKEELADLWVPWSHLNVLFEETEVASAVVQKPNNRLLSRQYHGSICNASGDEI